MLSSTRATPAGSRSLFAITWLVYVLMSLNTRGYRSGASGATSLAVRATWRYAIGMAMASNRRERSLTRCAARESSSRSFRHGQSVSGRGVVVFVFVFD